VEVLFLADPSFLINLSFKFELLTIVYLYFF